MCLHYPEILEDAAAQRATKTVCMLSSVHPPFDIRIYEKECRTLAEAGYQVSLVVPAREQLSGNGVRIVGVPPEKHRLLRMTRSVWRIYVAARRERAAVYHLHDPELLPVGVLLSALGWKVVYDAHEDLPKDVLDKPWIPSPFRKIVSSLTDWFERHAGRRMSAIVTAEDQISRRLSFTECKTVTLNNYPLAGEFGEFRPSSQAHSESKTIVSFGGLYAFRAVYPMVDALALISEELPVELLVAGGAESNRVEKELRAKPGWHRVDYRGQLRRSQMLSELSRAFAALILFRKAPNTYCVRSNRFFEALAAGVPVIAPNFGDWKCFVEGNRCGLAVNPEDPGEIADAIEWLFAHREEAAEMGRNGRRLFFSEFNWEKEGEKLVRLYDSLTRKQACAES